MSEQRKPSRPRCGAMRKCGLRCMSRALLGETKCRLHGGAGARANRGKPSHALTHGRTSKFVAVSDLDRVAEIAAALQTSDGKQRVLATSTAVAVMRSEKLPAEDHGNYLDYQNLIKNQVGALSVLEANDKSRSGEIIQISLADYGDRQNGSELARDGDGNSCTVRFLQGKAYIEDERTKVLYPATPTKDPEFGVELFVLDTVGES